MFARAFLCDANWKKKVDLLGKKCVRVRREDTRSLYTHTLHTHKKDEEITDVFATTATGRSDAPSPGGTGERVRAGVLHHGTGKVL